MLSKYLSLVSKRCLDGYKPPVLPGKFDNIIIAMSSGVDSSVAGSLFAGHFPNARGIYMQNWSESQSVNDPTKEKCYERDWNDVCKVGKRLNLPVDFVNFENDYWIDVFEPMLSSYKDGYTPNPDIGCNRFVKFGKLVQHLDKKYGTGNYWLVTGHYARVMESIKDGRTHLLKSYYKQKDQSYYLSQIDENVLTRLLFPIGNMTKPEVRHLAAEMNLYTANKPDSQGICFVNNSQHGKFKNFLTHYLPDSIGDIITVDEVTGEKKVWGKHAGLWSYTLGQKVGISMPQGDPKYKGAWFISQKLKETNQLVIVKGRDNPKLFQKNVELQSLKLLGLGKEEFQKVIKLALDHGNLCMQYRSLQEPIPVASCSFNETNDKITLCLHDEQRAIAQGQFGCLYIGERVLGSGTITRSW